MAALEAALSLSSAHHSASSSSLCNSFLLPRRLSSTNLCFKSPYFPLCLFLLTPHRKLRFVVESAVEEIVVEQNAEVNLKKKLCFFNLPWSLTVTDMKSLIGECGTVTDVEIIKQNNGKSRGFAFVTMASAEEAQAVIDKFDSNEVLGRVIRVEFAKRLKRPSPPRPPGPPPGETRHKLYVSNLAWKVRSNNLRDFFSENFNPVSTRVVFDSPSGKSAGYGFVSFATKEEAEAAVSALDGKELMGRPLQMKFSEKTSEEAKIEEEGEIVGDKVEGRLSQHNILDSMTQGSW